MELHDETAGTTALEFVSTIRHDGSGGVADDLADDAAVRRWIGDRWPGPHLSPDECDDVRLLRRASRAAFAATVSPAPPSPADSSRLMDPAEAGAILEEAISRLDLRQQVQVSPAGVASVRVTQAVGTVQALGALALAVVDFLAGPESERLRSCQAPRCVRYFVQTHGRQQWCKTSCGNRARAARFAATHGTPA